MKAEDKEFIYKLSFSRNGAEVKQNGELIRCKDCKWLCSDKRKRKVFYYCCQWDELGNNVTLNDFCSRAERRKNDL